MCTSLSESLQYIVSSRLSMVAISILSYEKYVERTWEIDTISYLVSILEKQLLFSFFLWSFHDIVLKGFIVYSAVPTNCNST